MLCNFGFQKLATFYDEAVPKCWRLQWLTITRMMNATWAKINGTASTYES